MENNDIINVDKMRRINMKNNTNDEKIKNYKIYRGLIWTR